MKYVVYDMPSGAIGVQAVGKHNPTKRCDRQYRRFKKRERTKAPPTPEEIEAKRLKAKARREKLNAKRRFPFI